MDSYHLVLVVSTWIAVDLDGALSNLVWWKMSLLMAGGLEPDDL